MKKYVVNVHFDVIATVEVLAANEDEALELAGAKAEEVPFSELEYCGVIGSCITNVID